MKTQDTCFPRTETCPTKAPAQDSEDRTSDPRKGLEGVLSESGKGCGSSTSWAAEKVAASYLGEQSAQTELGGDSSVAATLGL